MTADRTWAAELYERGCDHGDAAACYLLGTYYSLGRGGMEVDAEQALELFRLACATRWRAPPCRKSAKQCFMVGGIYEHGRAGAPVDEALALEFYRESYRVTALIDRQHTDEVAGTGACQPAERVIVGIDDHLLLDALGG